MSDTIPNTSNQQHLTSPLRIAVDAMGGDHAPAEVVRGAVRYVRMVASGDAPAGSTVLLVGDAAQIEAELGAAEADATDRASIEIVPTEQIIAMDDHPLEAVRSKPQSSLVVTCTLVKEGRAQAAFSAGNTGAMMVASLQVLERISGVKRPPIATYVPTETGNYALLVDAGANIDCKPSNLAQFAQLGAVYTRTVFGYEVPRVALLSNGEEETKGNELVKESRALLAALEGPNLHFAGNVEGNHIFDGDVDVIVCDGFEGNILLKGIEGMAQTILNSLQADLDSATDETVENALRDSINKLMKRVDYAEYGGAPLLGLNGVSLIAHGRSNARAIANGIRQAANAAQSGFVEGVRTAFAAHQKAPTGTETAVNG